MSTAANPTTASCGSEQWKDMLEEILPPQGRWTDEQYLVLTDQTNRLVEFADGFLEVLPVPTEQHQAILEFLFLAFLQFIKPNGGKVRFAPLRLQVRPGKFREPDRISCWFYLPATHAGKTSSGPVPTWPWKSSARRSRNATWLTSAPTMQKRGFRNTGS